MTNQRGVTLVELLVSMLILAAVMGLVSQAVSQVERIVRVADASQQALAERWGGGWALQLLFANVVAPREGAASAFKGESMRLQGYTTAAVLDSEEAVRQFELKLNVGPTTDGASQLLYSEIDTAGRVRGVPQVVASFSGRVAFEYRDRDGIWRAQWPSTIGMPAGTPAERLPSAVRVSGVDEKRLFISYPVLASGSFQRGDASSPFGDAPR